VVRAAKEAGLEIGERGGIRVDDQMHTSDPDIFAVGDAIEVKDFITGQWAHIPLAGPANRQPALHGDDELTLLGDLRLQDLDIGNIQRDRNPGG
jgi:NADPH-dependent 2,4-dienoyl-CoA reductase/sulfur reductase-like enzyme